MALYFDPLALVEWFQRERRDLPWRDDPSPYEVWISEVMLQQTKVDVVIPYYLRWKKLFPNVQSLSEAKRNDVIKAWEGMGYYSRARNLHEGARYVVANYEGRLPCDKKKLEMIKGLGPYTVAAILNFAFKKRAAAIDGNVIRVISRYYGIVDDIAKSKTKKKIRDLVEEILPERDYWIFSEALIELGALVCKKKPFCQRCPLVKSCHSYSRGVQELLPSKQRKICYQALCRSVALIFSERKVLVRKVEEGQMMAGLHEFPYFADSEGALKEKLEREWGIRINYMRSLPEQRHSFTKYRVLLRPQYFESAYFEAPEFYFWASAEDLERLAFSSGHKKILNHFKSVQ